MWLAWSIYNQLKHQSNLSLSWQQIKESFHSSLAWNLVIVVLLMIMNWGIESAKWKIAIGSIQRISFLKSFMAILSGVSFSVSTPNRMGEYIGRVLYMDEGKRLRAISLTITCSLSQLIVTLLMGVIGLLFLLSKIYASEFVSAFWVRILLYGVVAVLIVLTVFYFRLSWLAKWIDRIPAMSKYSYLVNAVESVHATLLLQLLSLSVLRFFVFGIQYYLLFRLFGVEIGWWQGFWATSVVFLVLAIIPTIALLEVVQRGTIALKVFGLLTSNELGIGLTTVSVWLINLVIPALIGSLLILGIKIFRYRNEDS
ncbi:MAG: flippase-like domain-containing protein [Bacteroidetes bacterium]|nr:flippase-like domain-containing protein [Bacteroidota bacterium]